MHQHTAVALHRHRASHHLRLGSLTPPPSSTTNQALFCSHWPHSQNNTQHAAFVDSCEGCSSFKHLRAPGSKLVSDDDHLGARQAVRGVRAAGQLWFHRAGTIPHRSCTHPPHPRPDSYPHPQHAPAPAGKQHLHHPRCTLSSYPRIAAPCTSSPLHASSYGTRLSSVDEWAGVPLRR